MNKNIIDIFTKFVLVLVMFSIVVLADKQ